MLVEVVGGYFANRSVSPDVELATAQQYPRQIYVFLQFGHYDRRSSLAV